MKNLREIIKTIIAGGAAAYAATAKGASKPFSLSLNTYPVGSLVGRHLLAVAYKLGFTDEYRHLLGLCGLPYYDNKNNQCIIDYGMPTVESVNYAIDTVAEDICGIKTKKDYYLSAKEVKTAYNMAKAKAKADEIRYNSALGYADKFEIGELDA